jgi:hypothetical protein
MILYSGPVDDPDCVVQFLRRELPNLRHLRKLVITREGATIVDVNGDTMEFPGLTFGNPVLERLLQELGVVYTPQTLHNPDATPDRIKEYRLSARWTWGHDRVM